MAGANIFVVYALSATNITLSPRLVTGHVEPQFNPDAQVSPLDGSGISNGSMRLSNSLAGHIGLRRITPLVCG
jgi:hypothetical protein